jgi:hypothetical protein
MNRPAFALPFRPRTTLAISPASLLRAIRKSAVPLLLSRQLADTASVRLWLADGFPFADILTMLEVRRRFELSPDVARAYAVEILSAARAEIVTANQPLIAHRKESLHAAA